MKLSTHDLWFEMIHIAVELSENMLSAVIGPDAIKFDTKSDGSLVSEQYDKANAAFMAGALHEKFPKLTLRIEDADPVQGDPDHVVFGDGLDCTNSLLTGGTARPSVGMTYCHKGEPAITVIALSGGPHKNDNVIIHAERGSGAYQIAITDLMRVKMAGLELPTPSRIGVVTGRCFEQRIGSHYSLRNKAVAAARDQFQDELIGLVQLWESASGSIGHTAFVAQGRHELTIIDCIGGPWDSLPAEVLIPEAGGKIYPPAPFRNKSKALVAYNGEFPGQIEAAFDKAYTNYAGYIG